jgi:hypothetical protein
VRCLAKVLAEAHGYRLTQGSEGLSGLPHHKNRLEMGSQRVDGFIHHVQWEHLLIAEMTSRDRLEE